MDTAQVSSFLTALGRLSAGAGVVVALVWSAQWVFRKQLTARARCALWWLVAVRLLLPVSFGSVTSVFNLLPHHTPAEPPRAANMTPVMPATSPAATLPNLSAPAFTAGVPGDSSPARLARCWADWFFCAWLAGVVLLAGHVLMSSIGLWRRCARLQPLTNPGTLAVLEDCCRRLPIKTKPLLLETSALSTPALHGLFHPRLLLPKGFTTRFSERELRFVFLHELSHLKRRDLWLNWVMTLLQVVHWFNPLVWFAFGRWRADRELACDAMALEAAGEEQNQEYGRTILRLLETFAPPASNPGLVGILEDKRLLRRRIAMIAGHVPARKLPWLALVLAAGVAAIGLTDAQKTTPKGSHMNKSNMTNPIARATVIGMLALSSTTTPTAETSTAMAVAPSQPAGELIGSWDLAGTPDKVRKPPAKGRRIKFFTGKHWCITHAEPETGVVVHHHGGTYTLQGSEYVETVQYANPTTINFVGQPNGHFALSLKDDALTLIGKDNPWKEVWKRARPAAKSAQSQLWRDLIGTWALAGKPDKVSEADESQLKFITATDWCDTTKDPKTGVVLYHHGGTYKLKGDSYVQDVEYANPSSMNLIGHSFKFKINVEGDTLTVTGINNPWTQVWKRAR